MKLKVNGKLRKLSKFGFHTGAKFIIHAIVTVNGHYIVNQKDKRICFFPSWESLGKELPFYVLIDEVYGLEALIDNDLVKWCDLVRVIVIKEKSGEELIAEKSE